jgi:hypothetical protein
MLEWLIGRACGSFAGFGTIGTLGVFVTVLSWHGGRQTKRILEEQGKILARQAEILAHMEANAVTRHNTVMDKLDEPRP